MILDEKVTVQEPPIVLSEKEVFLEIWTSPRRVFKFINEYKFDKHVYVLLYLVGISNAFGNAIGENSGDQNSLIGIIFSCIIFGGIVGWISYFIYAALLSWTGKWLGGKGNTDALLRMLSYAFLPSVVALVIVAFELLIFGKGVFQSNMEVYGHGPVPIIAYFTSMALKIILGLCTMVFVVIGTSEVQKISIWKAILNLILPVLMLIILGLILFIFGALIRI